MFSKHEASLLRKEFWTIFGQYIKPVPSECEEKVNWLNYKTGKKDILFKMDASGTVASISIEMVHQDTNVQKQFFEQFQKLERVFHEIVGEHWIWELHNRDENGKTTSRIYSTLSDVSIFYREDWPALISFFKTGMIKLDKFWSNAHYNF